MAEALGLFADEADLFLLQELKKTVRKTVLRKNEFCVVLDPVDAEGRPQLGRKEVRTGVCSFFLHPGGYIM